MSSPGYRVAQVSPADLRSMASGRRRKGSAAEGAMAKYYVVGPWARTRWPIIGGEFRQAAASTPQLHRMLVADPKCIADITFSYSGQPARLPHHTLSNSKRTLRTQALIGSGSAGTRGDFTIVHQPQHHSNSDTRKSAWKPTQESQASSESSSGYWRTIGRIISVTNIPITLPNACRRALRSSSSPSCLRKLSSLLRSSLRDSMARKIDSAWVFSIQTSLNTNNHWLLRIRGCIDAIYQKSRFQSLGDHRCHRQQKL